MNSHVKEKLQALFISYSKNLPAKINEIERTWVNLQKHFDKKMFNDFHREIHSLCGSAATYGYNTIAANARTLEVYLKPIVTQESLTEVQQNDITKYLNNLTKSLLTTAPEQLTFEHKPISTTITTNQIYIFDNDDNFVNEIQISALENGYTIIRLNKLQDLKAIPTTQQPAAIIVKIDTINTDEMAELQKFQSNDNPVPIFCTATSGNILMRLKAIRIGKNANFILKPIESENLIKKLDQLTGLKQSDPYRILIIDDSHSLAEYYALLLTDAGMVTRFITNPLLLIETINDFQPDLLLMDVYMPECTGLELATVLRQEEQYTRIPIIFLSTEDDRLKQLTALNIGGDDFLTKPIIPQHLINVVMSRAKRAGILRSFMTKDSLTGLLNHTNLLHRLDVELMRAKRQCEPLAFVMLDIDHFKLVNDQYGHPMGDKVLGKLSGLLLSSLRKTDIVGRYGGEEFAIILPATDPMAAYQICEKIRIQFSKISFNYNDILFNVTLSGGIATYPQLNDFIKLINLSDEALYAAKHNGRNQIQLFY